jgi:hypothetical protein
VAGLLAPVPRHQFRGDAEQPRPQGTPFRVEVASLREGNAERLRGDVLARLHVQPPDRVPVHVAKVAIVDGGELVRISPEPSGELGVPHFSVHVSGQVGVSIMCVPHPKCSTITTPSPHPPNAFPRRELRRWVCP